ncbi:MAG TPA: copper resistance protein CopC [bacterium]|nr:copper resistance protein CopC [bacterium]
MGAAVLWVAGRPIGALAHANLVRSDPPDLCSPQTRPRLLPGDPRCASGAVLPHAPAGVRLLFNEPVVLVGRGVHVLAPSGRRVERGPARVSGAEVTVGVDAAGEGTYRVIWRVIAQDTHPSQGAFAFSVGRAGVPPGSAASTGAPGVGPITGLILQAYARALHLAGYALSFGVLAFRKMVLEPLALTGDETERRVWRLAGAGVVALLAAEPLALLAQTVSLSAGTGQPLDPEVLGGALDSSFGRVLAQRLGAALLLWVLVGAASAGPARAAAAALILGLALAFVDGEAAHAVGARPSWLGLGLNTLHEAAMGAWVGGLVGLLSVWRVPTVAVRRVEIAARTGRLAAWSAVALVATGAGMAAQHLRGPADLVATAYGETLAAKLILFLAALGLAWGAARVAIDRRPRAWIREAAVLLTVLVLAGLLASLPPPV